MLKWKFHIEEFTNLETSTLETEIALMKSITVVNINCSDVNLTQLKTYPWTCAVLEWSCAHWEKIKAVLSDLKTNRKIVVASANLKSNPYDLWNALNWVSPDIYKSLEQFLNLYSNPNWKAQCLLANMLSDCYLQRNIQDINESFSFLDAEMYKLLFKNWYRYHEIQLTLSDSQSSNSQLNCKQTEVNFKSKTTINSDIKKPIDNERYDVILSSSDSSEFHMLIDSVLGTANSVIKHRTGLEKSNYESNVAVKNTSPIKIIQKQTKDLQLSDSDQSYDHGPSNITVNYNFNNGSNTHESNNVTTGSLLKKKVCVTNSINAECNKTTEIQHEKIHKITYQRKPYIEQKRVLKHETISSSDHASDETFNLLDSLFFSDLKKTPRKRKSPDKPKSKINTWLMAKKSQSSRMYNYYDAVDKMENNDKPINNNSMKICAPKNTEDMLDRSLFHTGNIKHTKSYNRKVCEKPPSAGFITQNLTENVHEMESTEDILNKLFL